MKYKNTIFLAATMFVSMTIAACDNNQRDTNNNKEYENIIERTRDLDETYHPTAEQKKQLEDYKQARAKIQQASAENTKQ